MATFDQALVVHPLHKRLNLIAAEHPVETVTLESQDLAALEARADPNEGRAVRYPHDLPGLGTGQGALVVQQRLEAIQRPLKGRRGTPA